ncbi:MAG: hypothetical protein E7012_00865 [Alphaproteobacteria bacterium]|nr:hypothetical protein [Alphaproteobacteria bacterium]
MIDQEDDLDGGEETSSPKPINRKKMLILVLPVVIVIGLSVGLYFALNKDYNNTPGTYNIIQNGKSEDGTENITVFYDLPEINARIKSVGPDKKTVSLALNVELSKIEDVQTLDILSPRIKDAVLSHVIELTPEEIEGANGIYWLKEELLYRLNLVVAPVRISSLNIKQIEVINENKEP